MSPSDLALAVAAATMLALAVGTVHISRQLCASDPQCQTFLHTETTMESNQ